MTREEIWAQSPSLAQRHRPHCGSRTTGSARCRDRCLSRRRRRYNGGAARLRHRHTVELARTGKGHCHNGITRGEIRQMPPPLVSNSLKSVCQTRLPADRATGTACEDRAARNQRKFIAGGWSSAVLCCVRVVEHGLGAGAGQHLAVPSRPCRFPAALSVSALQGAHQVCCWGGIRRRGRRRWVGRRGWSVAFSGDGLWGGRGMGMIGLLVCSIAAAMSEAVRNHVRPALWPGRLPALSCVRYQRRDLPRACAPTSTG